MKKLFIGREKYLKKLRKDFFVTEPGQNIYCCSLVGPNDIGKTMLVQKLAEEFKEKNVENVYYFDLIIRVKPGNFMWDFWTEAIMRMSDEITEEKLRSAPGFEQKYLKEILKIYDFFNSPEQQELIEKKPTAFGMQASLYLPKLFRYYTRIGIHIILTIDEFDLARIAVPEESEDGSFFQWLFTLSPKGSEEFNLSIMLISRRHVSTIAHHMFGGSSIDSAYPRITLRGFDNEELKSYFNTYEDLPCGALSEREKRSVIYFCGRHPGLLMDMRNAISGLQRDGELDIAKIFAENSHMREVYDRMIELMKAEHVDRARRKNCVGIFAQIFIGPAYEEHLPSYIERCFDLGFLTRADVEEEDLFELAGVTQDGEEEGNRFGYEPLSPYFVEYFKNVVLPEEKEGTAALLNHTEIMVRKTLLTVLQSAYPDSYEEILQSYAEGKEFFLNTLNGIALRNDAASRNLTFTELDVLSFMDYAKIITAHSYWDLVHPYLSSYIVTGEVQRDFGFLVECRNCFAHNNSEVLNQRNVTRLEGLCKRICEDIEKGNQNPDLPMGPEAAQEIQDSDAASAGPATFYTKEDSIIREILESGKTYTLICEKTSRGTLRGPIKEITGFHASISAQNAAGIPYERGMELPVKLIDWDANPNGQKFNAEPV